MFVYSVYYTQTHFGTVHVIRQPIWYSAHADYECDLNLLRPRYITNIKVEWHKISSFSLRFFKLEPTLCVWLQTLVFPSYVWARLIKKVGLQLTTTECCNQLQILQKIWAFIYRLPRCLLYISLGCVIPPFLLKIFLESVLLDGSKRKFGVFQEYDLNSKLVNKQLVLPSQAQPILFEPKAYIKY